ncbi:Neuropeptide-Like Protein [Caenorhabditis elegans]|uniref:Neuropeptide-Like Protein n=1 Tax=Caenorhabditis elegans TaxID=6239 RepID=A5A8Q1_CAEEL|nr:Neuropeptide-Like Protein [Caenorhabditis elegans]CCD73519.1 Neuropeptide-Like Protein [Caenorhabditis elegans]|eukprot:NP_001122552.1 Uncharacterized protein CELE_Y71F9AM.8 [Caenorhabditis elegans]
MNFTTVLMSFFFIFPIVFNKPIGNEINEIGHFSKNPPFYSTDLFSLNENANENLRMSPIELNFWKKLRDGFLDFLKNAHGHIGK